MTNAMTVFISGIIGVFFGMTLLYLSVIVTGKTVDRLEKKQESKAKKKDNAEEKKS